MCHVTSRANNRGFHIIRESAWRRGELVSPRATGVSSGTGGQVRPADLAGNALVLLVHGIVLITGWTAICCSAANFCCRRRNADLVISRCQIGAKMQ